MQEAAHPGEQGAARAHPAPGKNQHKGAAGGKHTFKNNQQEAVSIWAP